MNINPRLLIGLAVAALTYLSLTALVGPVGNRDDGYHCGRADWHSQSGDFRQPENFHN